MKKSLIFEEEAEGLEESDLFAQKIAQKLNPDDIVLLYGDLGAGKTYLVKRIVKHLNISSEVTSPSFSIINQYGASRKVFHLDLYRIKNKQEIINTGFEEILNSDAIVLIEWPQIVEEELNWKHYRLYIETNLGNQYWRKFSFYEVN